MKKNKSMVSQESTSFTIPMIKQPVEDDMAAMGLPCDQKLERPEGPPSSREQLTCSKKRKTECKRENQR